MAGHVSVSAHHQPTSTLGPTTAPPGTQAAVHSQSAAHLPPTATHLQSTQPPVPPLAPSVQPGFIVPQVNFSVGYAPLRTFDGRGTETIDEFLQDYETIATANGWVSPTDKRTERLIGYLEKAPLQAYRMIRAKHGDGHLPWATMKQGLRTTFGSLHSPVMCLDRLENRAQLAGERLEDYLFDKLRLCNQTDRGMTEAQKILYVIRGLHPDLIAPAMNIYDRLGPSVTWNKFFHELQRKEATHKMVQRRRLLGEGIGETSLVLYGSEHPAPSVDRPPPPPVHPPQPVLDDLLKIMTQMKDLLIASRPPPQDRRPSFRQTDNSSGRNRFTANGKPICNHCGNVGHMIRECRQRQRGRQPAPQQQGDGQFAPPPSSQNSAMRALPAPPTRQQPVQRPPTPRPAFTRPGN